MPKIIDHPAYRHELATKAITVFIQHGYHGLGMRGIADAIGVSKSALYHYFPSKEELFAASTEIVSQPCSLYGVDDDEKKPNDPTAALMAMLNTLDKRYRGELSLSLDYIRGKQDAEVAQDPLMNRVNSQYLKELAQLVGETEAKQAFALVLGGLMMRLWDGKQTELGEIGEWLLALREREESSTK